MGHTYKFESDVLVAAGPIGLSLVADEDNTVHVDFKTLEERGDDNSTDPNKFEYQEVENWINSLPYATEGEYSEFKTPPGGVISSKDPPRGIKHITRSPSTISRLRREGIMTDFPDFLKYTVEPLKSGLIEITSNNPKNVTPEEVLDETGLDSLNPNQYVLVNNQLVYAVRQPLTQNEEGTRFRLNGRPDLDHFDRNRQINSRLPGFKARDLEQKLGFKQLTSPNTELSFLTGGSSSGKTVIAYAAALNLILRGENADPTYNGIIVFKSNDIIGGKRREIGFLPGSAYDKVRLFLRGFEDAHKLIGADRFLSFKEMLQHPEEEIEDDFGIRAKNRNKIGDHYIPPRNAAVEVEYLQFGRGRTFENKVIIVDEAQNYTPFELKNLLERVGIGSKVFLVGDPEQIDNPKLDLEFNGLVYAANKVIGKHPRLSFMHLDKNYRSQTAQIMRRHRAPRII